MIHRAALGVPCPQCGALENERCPGADLGAHVARISAWQAAARASHVRPPAEERERVHEYLKRVRAELGWVTRDTERG